MTARANLIRQHIPSITDENEAELIELIPGLLTYDKLGTPDTDIADMAIRTCACGTRIDGFYEYVDHITAKLEEAGL